MNPDPPRFNLRHWLQNAVVHGLIRVALAIRYERRIPLFGALLRRVVAPLTGYRRRALDNLELIWPQMPLARRMAIADAVADNAGRTLIENYSTAEFIARMQQITPIGPGFVALQAAVRQGRPAILVSGHFGNYEAARASLVAHGFAVGGLYRPMINPYFNRHYVRTMEAFGGPVFAQGRKGTAGFVRHLRAGGQLVLLFDQHVDGAPWIDFLGRPARTSFSAAELALKYGALLIPFFATRNPDGLSFTVELETPIEASDAATMTAGLSASLAARVRARPEQWFWIHRRWK